MNIFKIISSKQKVYKSFNWIHIICLLAILFIVAIDVILLYYQKANAIDFEKVNIAYLDVVISNSALFIIFIITFWIIDSKRIRNEIAKKNNLIIMLWLSYQKLASINEENPSFEFLTLLDFSNITDKSDLLEVFNSSINICFPYHKEIINYGLEGFLEESHFANYLVFYNIFRELIFSINGNSIPDNNEINSIVKICNDEIKSLAEEPIIKTLIKQKENQNK